MKYTTRYTLLYIGRYWLAQGGDEVYGMVFTNNDKKKRETLLILLTTNFYDYENGKWNEVCSSGGGNSGGRGGSRIRRKPVYWRTWRKIKEQMSNIN